MSRYEEAIMTVQQTGKSILIECNSEKNQESTRTILFHTKKKKLLGIENETIGITKIQSPDGRLFVEIFKRQVQELFTRDANGNIVLLEQDIIISPDFVSQVYWMRRDGKPDDEIREVLHKLKNGEDFEYVKPVDNSLKEVSKESYTEINIEKLLSQQNQENESWKAEEKDVRKSEKELMKEMFCEGE